MSDTVALTNEVLDAGFLLVLATSDESGPWSAPVTYVRGDGYDLYWVSSPDARHSRAIVRVKRVAASVIVNHDIHDERALQISGTVRIVAGPLPELEAKLAKKRGVPVEEESDFIRNGNYVWYCLTPDLLKLNYTLHFGYDNQTITP